jgi:pimeloyl-ACP methyl ester carboxylesterase
MRTSNQGNAAIKPFSLEVPDATLQWIADKVAAFDWERVEAPSDGGWGYGTDRGYIKELCAYWEQSYDWRKQEAAINRFDQFTASVDGLDIHFIYEKGSGDNPMPLILSHGWPGSVCEFLDLIEPLAHPERFGGDVKDAFDVVVPSLPGFGFSQKPERPLGPRAVAGYFGKLMEDVLGYQRYVAQGGDWGSVISSWIGFDHKETCAGVHINMMGLRAKGVFPETDEEKSWAKAAHKSFDDEGGYFHLQRTRPQTLAYAMMDSPVGVAAWIIEKFNAWSDGEKGDLDTRFTKDLLLTNIMVYLVTETFNTASWIYYGFAEERSAFLPKGERIEVPVAVANFPKEFMAWPPRSFAEKAMNIVRWTDMPSGGHFAALEEPDFLISDLRSFCSDLF